MSFFLRLDMLVFERMIQVASTTKLKLAVELVERAVQAGISFRAVVAASFYGEDRAVKQGLRDLGVGYVLVLKPSHAWWHPEGAIGSFQEAARTAGWEQAERPGQWMKVTRRFRDGSSQDWWALEVVTGPYGPEKRERVVIATTDPATLPDLTTFYLVTNLPAPGSQRVQDSSLAPANLQAVVRLYGLRMWVEQSYKQVKYALGWSQYQVRSDLAMQRHWQLVCCAFSFCWYHQGQVSASETKAGTLGEGLPGEVEAQSSTLEGGEKKKCPDRTGAPQTLLASGPASRAGLARTLDHALALLESMVGTAPTPCPPVLI